MFTVIARNFNYIYIYKSQIYNNDVTILVLNELDYVSVALKQLVGMHYFS